MNTMDGSSGPGGPDDAEATRAAEDALMAGDLDRAIAEYDALLSASPGDAEAAVGKARAQLMKRTSGADLDQARSAAAAAPDDLDVIAL